MPQCPFKADTNHSNALCALRYRNAQLETCINPATKPGFGDTFCKSCLIGKKLNNPNNPDNIKPLRTPQGKTLNTDSNISIDSKREYELDGTKLFAVINLKGRNTNSPRLANNRGEVVAKICSACIFPKWLSDYYDQEHPSICKSCFNKRTKKRKSDVIEDKEYIKTPVKNTLPAKVVDVVIDKQEVIEEIKETIAPEVIKEKPDNKEKIRNIINDYIDLKMMALENRITEIISKQFEDLKRKVLLDVGTALLIEAKK